MGCDIHVYVERLNEENVWRPVYGRLQECSDCDGTQRVNAHCTNCSAEPQDHDEETGRCYAGPLTLSLTDEPCLYCENSWAPPGFEEDWAAKFYTGRDYDLFSVLGVHHRGTPDDDFTQADRGIPDDCSPEYSAISEGADWHSHTWYTLAELRKYPFKKKFRLFYKGMQRMADIEPNPTRIRMLMFFDN